MVNGTENLIEAALALPVGWWNWYLLLETGNKIAVWCAIFGGIPIAAGGIKYFFKRKNVTSDATPTVAVNISNEDKIDSGELALKIYNDYKNVSDELRDAQQRLQESEQEVAGLKDAIDGLRTMEEQNGNSKYAIEAEKELANGDTKLAKALFLKVAEEKEKEGKSVNSEAAQAYRRLGSLAFLNSTQDAIDAYQKAVDLDPDNADGWNQLGRLLYRTGDMEEAARAYKRVLKIGEATKDDGLLAVAFGNLGVLRKTQGDLKGAEEYYLKALALNEELGRKEGIAIL
ncbi:tetratricopeptide repeat protein, partial [Maridesulfovibrio zosterae]|uniref:tetratricopeptide repeat protein n=1 Tax=Maridesulfovibrio zosterae TaxID=82171 RepID=UPI00146E09F8